MVKIAKRPFEELTEFLERELEDRLGAVLRIDLAGVERLLVRDDLALHSDEELAESFYRAFPGATAPSGLLSGLAEGPDCCVGFGDETVRVLLYRDPDETIAIAFDRAPEDALSSFVERCLATVR